MNVRSLVKYAVEKSTNNLLYRRNLQRLAKQEIELEILPILVENDALCLDIGANRGLYLNSLLKLTKNVVAFEPLAPMREILSTNYLGRIRLEPVALSDAPGFNDIRFPQGNYSWATIEKSNTLALTSDAIQHEKIETRTLDEYSFKNVGFIKIDVEGHEEAVLHGGHETLLRCHPALIIEIEERHKPGAITRINDLLSSLDYSGHFIEDRELCPIAKFDLSRDQRMDHVGVSGKCGHYVNKFIFVTTAHAEKFCAAANALLAAG